MPLAIGIIGSTGKMGKNLISLILKNPNSFSLSGEISSKSFSTLGQGLLSKKSDLLIDFSHPSALQSILQEAIFFQKPLVIGTTGFSKEDFEKIKQASTQIPILYSANFSLGIAVLKKCASLISASFPKQDLFCEIVEIHHHQKKDRPSGTALALAEEIKKTSFPSQNIPIHSLRYGNIIGEHILHFDTPEERLELKHEAHSREVFAKGALFAASFLFGKQPGLYTLEEALNQPLEDIHAPNQN